MQKAGGTSGGLSGVSHPNVVFGREHRTIDAAGKIIFRCEQDDIENGVKMALLSFADELKHGVSFHDCDQDEAVDKLEDIAGHLDALGNLPVSS